MNDYVIEAGRPTDQRRRAVVVKIVLLVGVLALGALAATLLLQRFAAPAPPSCTTASSPAPETIAVDVHNATGRGGLASTSASALRAQRFAVKDVDNAPAGTQVAGVAEVRHGKSGIAAAQVLAARIPGAHLVDDGRADASLDLYLGDAFTAVAAPPAPTARAC